ncbi:MAG TPA: L,D-transpeptidase family protein [Ideonella sp.]|uniref:L,D-transpeptidase family protein n=1 Tax=Ideonella sp. TaxID=1929293 RepID=UPI002E3807C0|nr:L,D-transpeptidase family protein [Ideonella sp.]HEX5684154.1 L,D-transpeptidase family protein [Ideonella sp.]
MKRESPHNPRKRRGAVLLGTVGLLSVGVLSTTDSRGLGWWSRDAHAHAPPSAVSSTPAMRLADDTPALRLPDPTAALQGSPEARLIAIYRLVGQRRLHDALAANTALVQQYPNFRLALLLQADLLAAHAAPLQGWGGGVMGSGDVTPLRAEALQRLAALRARPPAGAVPAEFVQLPPTQPYAIAVDASRSRLYLFENSEDGLKLIDDFYVSVGKQGVDKLAEGDQKTPLGLYFVTGQIEPHRLEDRFGAGALPLNYPNAYDRTRGRTGKGILLHGVPSATYSRPPQDSDGCVVLANDDLLGLSSRLPQRDTPVLISRKIDWRTPEAARAAARPDFLQTFERWRAARLAADGDTMASFYPSATAADADINLTRSRQRATSAPAPAAIDETSLISFRDDRELMVVTFREQAGNIGNSQQVDHVMRQYWSREGNDWRIVAEGQVH